MNLFICLFKCLRFDPSAVSSSSLELRARWQNLGHAVPEAHLPESLLLAGTCHVDDVPVLQELPDLSALPKLNLLRPLPALLEHGPEAVLGLAADGSASEQIARAHVAAGDTVVHKLLLDVPV